MTKPIGITDDNKLAPRVLRAIADSDELSSTIAEQVADAVAGFATFDPRLASLKSVLDAGRSGALWFTGDSTLDWNGTVDPTTRFAQNVAAAYPGHRVCILPRKDASDAWDVPVVVQAGPSGRRHAVLTGTRGLRWRGPVAQRNIAGVFDLRLLIAPDTWTPSANRNLFSSLETSTTGLQFDLRQKATGVLSVRVSTTGTSMSSDRDSSVPVTGVDGQFQWVRATFVMDGTNITTTFYTSPADDGVTWTQLGTPHVSSSAATTLAPATESGFYMVGARGWQPSSDGFAGKIAQVRISNAIDGPYNAPVPIELWEKYPDATVNFAGSPTVWIINAARSGSNMAYHTDPTRLAFETINFGQSVLIFSDSHNEVGSSGAVAWTDPYRAWVNAVLARLPLAAVAVVKQNPHTSAWPNEAAYGQAHVQRLDELGALAAREGWSIIDLLSAFLNDPRGLGALISSDGLHPTATGYAFSGDEYSRALGVSA